MQPSLTKLGVVQKNVKSHCLGSVCKEDVASDNQNCGPIELDALWTR